MSQNDVFKLGESGYIEYEVQDEIGDPLNISAYSIGSMKMYFHPADSKSGNQTTEKAVVFSPSSGTDGLLRYFYDDCTESFLKVGEWRVWCRVVWDDGTHINEKFTEAKTLYVKNPWEL